MRGGRLILVGLILVAPAAGSEPSPRVQDPQPAAPAPAPDAAPAPDVSERPPLPPPGYMDHCVALIQRGAHAEARRRLEPVVADHPQWGRAHFYLALTYHKEYRYEQARALFERAMVLEPDYVPAHMFYGWCLYYLGELDAAEAQFNAFLKVRPDYPDAIFGIGLVAFDADDLPKARAHLERAIALGQTGGDASMEAKSRARFADVLVRENRLPDARRELERSIELNGDNYEAYYKLSRVLERLGDADGAQRARALHEQVRERIRPSQPQGERRPGE